MGTEERSDDTRQCSASRTTCELMDKNRIQGRHGLESWHHTANPFGSSMEVNTAVVQGSIEGLPREASVSCVVWLKSAVEDIAVRAVMSALCAEESAESIVVVLEPVSRLCLCDYVEGCGQLIR